MEQTIRRIALLILLISGCASPTATPSPLPTSAPPTRTPVLVSESVVFPKIDRRPAAANYYRGKMTEIPSYDPNSTDPFQMDLRAFDLSALDLSHSSHDLLYAIFDDQTVWPPDDRMPQGFDWERILELGKNPGLDVRSLHAQGITGRGVGIAIIDQPLLTEHQEYAGRLRFYEEINVERTTGSQMHGPAVASIAVGKTTGVAPEADLYYIGSWTGDFGKGEGDFTWNFIYYAQAVRRILEINEQLPEAQKIRVISMQVGWNPGQDGYAEITAAVKEAQAAGMLVVSSSLEEVHGFKFNGLGRSPLADPDLFESYELGLFWARAFSKNKWLADRLLIPMDSRTTASPCGADEYVFYRQGGWSWSIPYIAGMYALAAQVDPNITPERFWSLAIKTGRKIEIEHAGEMVSLGPILDPVALIDALQKN